MPNKKSKVLRFQDTSAFSQIELAETGKVPNKVQILKVGKFKHQTYGDFEITTKTLSEMKKNFDDNVRGIDVAFDYFHASDKEASGWVEKLELKEGGKELWATVEWTPTASKKLSDRELRYFSPDFAFQWTDPESGVKHSNVLFGGGLTNRPFLKEMQAIVAAEDDEEIQDFEECECEDEENCDCEIELGGPGSGPQGAGSERAATNRAVRKSQRVGARNAAAVKSQNHGIASLKGKQSAGARRAESKSIAKSSKMRSLLRQGKPLPLSEGEVGFEEEQSELQKLAKLLQQLGVQMAKPIGAPVAPAQAKPALPQVPPVAAAAKPPVVPPVAPPQAPVAKPMVPPQAPVAAAPKPALPQMPPQQKPNAPFDAYKKQLSETLNQGANMLTIEQLNEQFVALKAAHEATVTENETLKATNATLLAEKTKADEAVKLAEKENEFTVMLSEGKACPAQKAAFIEGNMSEFVKLAQPLNTKGSGSSSTASATEEDKNKQIIKLAEEKKKANPSMAYDECVSQAKKEIEKA